MVLYRRYIPKFHGIAKIHCVTAGHSVIREKNKTQTGEVLAVIQRTKCH